MPDKLGDEYIVMETKDKFLPKTTEDTEEMIAETFKSKDRPNRSLGNLSHVYKGLPPKTEMELDMVYNKHFGITPMVFIAIEFILSYCNASCLFMITDVVANRELEFNLENVSYTFVACHYSAMWLGLFYCYLAECYIGKKLMNVIALILASICPLVTSLSTFPGVEIENRKRYVQWIVYSVIFTISSVFPRRVYALDQLKLPRDVELMTRYLFWLEFVTRLGTILAYCSIYFRGGINATYINHLVVLLLYFITIAIFILIDDSLLVLASYFRIIDVHVMCLINAAINSIRYKTDLKSHWTDYADEEKYSQEIIFDSKCVVEILLILFPLIYAGSLITVVHYTTMEYQYPILYKEKNTFGDFNPEVVYIILDSIILPLVEFVILPLGVFIGVWKHCLRAIGIALCIILTSGIICTILESMIQNEMGYLPTYLYGQLRIYNTLPTETSVETDKDDKNFQIHAKDNFVFLHHLPGDITMTFTNVEANLKVNKTITVRSDQSHSYIISNEGVIESYQPDPIGYSILSYKQRSAQLYVVTPHENLDGNLILLNSKFKQSIISFSTSRLDFHVSIESNETYRFLFDNTTHLSELARDVKIPYNTLYAIVIYNENGRLLGQVYEVVPPVLLSSVWVLPQAILLSLARSFVYLSLGTFVAVESPWHARGTLLAFMYLLFHNGFGTRLYVDWTTRTNLANLGTHVGLTTFAMLVFYYYSHYFHYKFLTK